MPKYNEFEVNPEDVCPAGGGHELELEEENEYIQKLKCKHCKYVSVGYFVREEDNE